MNSVPEQWCPQLTQGWKFIYFEL